MRRIPQTLLLPLLALLQPLLAQPLSHKQDCVALGRPRYDAICSARGVQHYTPVISDDFVVACIMIMFLLLFCCAPPPPPYHALPPPRCARAAATAAPPATAAARAAAATAAPRAVCPRCAPAPPARRPTATTSISRTRACLTSAVGKQ
jgi:hypothetical protein